MHLGQRYRYCVPPQAEASEEQNVKQPAVKAWQSKPCVKQYKQKGSLCLCVCVCVCYVGLCGSGKGCSPSNMSQCFQCDNTSA